MNCETVQLNSTAMSTLSVVNLEHCEMCKDHLLRSFNRKHSLKV
nr:MAG TPA: hypothetical protein [Caudoviricetes sp.]